MSEPTFQRRERSANDILMGGGGNKSVSFGPQGAAPGAYIEGTVVEEPRMAPDTNYATGAVETWPDGRVKEHPVITLQTQVREDPDDDGVRDLHVKVSKQQGGMSKEIADSVKKAGGQFVEVGAWLRVDYTAVVQTSKGQARAYAAQYRRPGNTALMGDASPAVGVQAAPLPATHAAPPATVAAAVPAVAAGPSPVETAKALLASGVSHDVIAASTGLGLDVIAALANLGALAS